MAIAESRVPQALQPRAEDYGFDLDRALSAVVGLHAMVPQDAFTAETLGTERAGNGVAIDDGLVLTIGYLVTEAETVWIHRAGLPAIEGTVLGVDYESGFGLVQTLGRYHLPALSLGDSAAAKTGQRVVTGGASGRSDSLASHVVAREPFAGYWEYALDDAIFAAPAHPNWGGTGLIDERGELIGIGSLQLESTTEGGITRHVNMMVPTDLLKPILSDLTRYGRSSRPPRPWLGLYATEIEGAVIIAGLAPRGPAVQAQLKTGDTILAVGGEKVNSLLSFYRRMWALGSSGVDVPLTLLSRDITFDVTLKSTDRAKMLRVPRMH